MLQKSVFRLASGSQYGDRTMTLKNLATPAGQCMGIAASHAHIAACYGNNGGSIVILPMDISEFKRNDAPPLVNAHASPLADLKFSPWNANQLATGSDDGTTGTVKLWDIPTGGLTENLSEAKVKIDVASPVRNFEFHPAADGVLATGTKDGVCILDLEKGNVLYTFPIANNGAAASAGTLSLSWSEDGARLAVLGKNSSLTVFDPRIAPKAQLDACATIDSKKPQHVFFVKDKLCVLAQNSTQKPFVAYYEVGDLSKPSSRLDLALSPGFVMPLYDPDTELLFLAPRGANTVNMFDVSEQKTAGGPSFTQCPGLTLDSGCRGACLIPKSALETSRNEVQRLLSLTPTAVEQYKITVPRKNVGFNEELYPATRDCSPAMDAAEYATGRDTTVAKTHILKLVSKSNEKSGKALPQLAINVAALNVAEASSPPVTPVTSAAPSAAQSFKVQPSASRFGGPIASPTASSSSASASFRQNVAASASEKRQALNEKLKVSLFKHVDGFEPRELGQCFSHLSPFLGAIYLNKALRANQNHLVFPSKVGNGSTLCVMDQGKVGRAKETMPTLKGHKAPITAFDVSTVDPALIVSADQSGVIRVWNVPGKGLVEDQHECVWELQAKGKVTVCNLSESVRGLLATASSSSDGHCVQVWDALVGSEECCIDGFHSDTIIDLQFDPYGHLLATSCKDGKVRVLDLRAKTTIAILQVKENLRDTQLIWVSRSLLLVLGTGKGSRRSLSMWDVTKKEQVASVDHDMSSATFLPHYDRSTGVLFTANNGGTNIEIWEISSQAPFIESLRTYTSPTMVQGFAFTPKLQGVDIPKVQIGKAFKLVEDRIVPINWSVLRKRLEFFQDDLFPAVWDQQALCSSTQWFAGDMPPEGKDRVTVSLQPEHMAKLSEAPEEELTVREQRYQAHVQQQEAPKAKGVLGHESAAEVSAHFAAKAKDMPTTNRFDKAYDENAKSVDDSEWD